VLSECLIALESMCFFCLLYGVYVSKNKWLECEEKVENGGRELLSCVYVKRMVEDDGEFIGEFALISSTYFLSWLIGEM
jgi:hypothetical protein